MLCYISLDNIISLKEAQLNNFLISYINNIIYTDKIIKILFNSLTNTEDYKLLILKRVIIMMIKLIIYKLLNISLSELLLIL